jgi:hypothetical protein
MMTRSENVGTALVYTDKDTETQEYADLNVALLTVDRNPVTGNVEIWGDDLDDTHKTHLNMRMSPTAAEALGRALIAASNNNA